MFCSNKVVRPAFKGIDQFLKQNLVEILSNKATFLMFRKLILWKFKLKVACTYETLIDITVHNVLRFYTMFFYIYFSFLYKCKPLRASEIIEIRNLTSSKNSRGKYIQYWDANRNSMHNIHKLGSIHVFHTCRTPYQTRNA